MTLVVDELFDGITFTQNFRIQKSAQIVHIRPWVYKHGVLLSGDLTLQILSDSEVLKEMSINFVDINLGIPGTFAHGQIRFDSEPLQLNHDRTQEFTTYQIKLFMDNYVDNVNAFMGSIRRYELKFYGTYGEGVIDGEAPNDLVEPLGFELFEYTY